MSPDDCNRTQSACRNGSAHCGIGEDRYRGDDCTDDEGNLQTESVPVDVNNHNATGEFADFYKTIAGDLSVSTPAIEGCKTVQAALAIVKSADLGGVPVKL